jgi:polar amino acid transport system substrate-binding protein
MRAIHIICFLALTSAAFITTADADIGVHNHQLNIAIEDSWPPYADINGQGHSRDILERALELTQIEYRVQVEPYSRALYLTKSGLVNACLNVTRQSSTESVFHFGEEPLFIADAYFFVSPKNQLQMQSLREAPDHYKVGVITGYEYGEQFEIEKHRLFLSEVRTQEQLIAMLKTGRLDAIIMYDEVYEHTRIKMGLPQDLFRRAFLNHSSDIHVAFNKENQWSKSYAAQLDVALRALKASDQPQHSKTSTKQTAD